MNIVKYVRITTLIKLTNYCYCIIVLFLLVDGTYRIKTVLSVLLACCYFTIQSQTLIIFINVHN